MCEISLPASFPSPDCSFPAARAVTVPFSAAGPQSKATKAWSRVASQWWDSCTCSRRPAGPLASRFASSCQDFWWHSEETDILCAHVAAPEAAHTWSWKCGHIPVVLLQLSPDCGFPDKAYLQSALISAAGAPQALQAPQLKAKGCHLPSARVG